MSKHELGSSRFTALLAGLLMCAACGNDESSTGTQGSSPDMGAVDMPVDISADTGNGLVASGGICGKSEQCASGLCVASQCATEAGDMCGVLHCKVGQVCEDDQCLDSATCPAAQTCAGACCAEGQVCEANECVTPCEDGRLECVNADGAGVCCEESAACLFGGCIELGNACNDDMPCARDQFCEPTLSRCVPRDADPNQCIYIPPVEDFQPVEAWSWTQSAVSPEYDQVMTSPVVGNLTDDNGDGKIDSDDIPDVVFTTFKGSGYNNEGVLRVISGDDGREIWSSTGLDVPFLVRGATTPALADIDGDGVMELIVAGDPAGGESMMAVEHTGEIKWEIEGVLDPRSGGPAIANLDGEGLPEIIASNNVLSANGDVICLLGPRSYVPLAADMDLDGRQEILMGSAIWRLDDVTKTDGTGCSEVVPGLFGYTAVANLDDDDFPEIVMVNGGSMTILEHTGEVKVREAIPRDDARIEELYGFETCEMGTAGQACTAHTDCGPTPARCYATPTGDRQCYISKACYPGGGSPTVADFDGDGQAEIAVAGAWYYVVYEADGTILWAHSTQDFSSAVTGSSVFDFEGDGRAEVVYNDELFLRVYRGAGSGVDEDGDGFNDAVILLEEENTSGTLYEYPLIVDVDNDANAEIVVSANNYRYASNPDITGTQGIRVFKDRQNNWVGTRRIWNQHTYHVTNIDEDGQVPLTEENNWQVEFLNNYRQNVQGDGLFNAPDLVVAALDAQGAGCAGAGASISFELRNEGSLGVRAGALSATVYIGEVEPLNKITTITNTQPLGPGGVSRESFLYQPDPSELNKELRIRVVVDEDADGNPRYNECNEDNNTLEQSFLCESAG